MKCHQKYLRSLSSGPCVALIGSLLMGPPQGLAKCRIQLQRAAAFDGLSAYLFADRDEDSAQSSLRAAPERRH